MFLNYVPLQRALTNCIDILRPCLHALRGVDDTKLESHVEIMANCFQNCKMVLEHVEGNSVKTTDMLPDCVASCKACLKVCKEIDHDLFKKAMVAINDCLVELNNKIKSFNKVRK